MQVYKGTIFFAKECRSNDSINISYRLAAWSKQATENAFDMVEEMQAKLLVEENVQNHVRR